MNTHWKLLKITTFGESHWVALWVVIDWFPSNFFVDIDNLKAELKRRKPWQSNITTQRVENDEDFEILSGLFEWKTTWHPITIIVRNKNNKSKDYDNIKDLFRPNHADFTYQKKYWIRDYRWWWRSSGRETLSRVIAWAIAKQFLKEKLWIQIFAYTKQIGDFIAKDIDYSFIEKNVLRTADKKVFENMLAYVNKIKEDWNSVWWIIECKWINIPVWLWEPVFWKIKSRISSSMLSIWGCLWFEYWPWFWVTSLTWKTYNEWFINTNWKIHTKSNKYWWILGGITTGEDIIFRVAIKPTWSIYSKQQTVDINWNKVDFQISWRHDPCILPRVIPVIESMLAIDLLDLYLIDNSKK
jgi:chorismate synthase